MSVATESIGPTVLDAVHDYGDQALLLQFTSTEEVLAWTEALRTANLLGVVDIVPAARTVLLKLAGWRYQAPTRQRLRRIQLTHEQVRAALAPPAAGVDVVIEVVYDGIDLPEVARLTGLEPQQVVAAHTGRPWRVGFGGFTPGFAYLGGGDERLKVPRRAEPRTKVPAGSIGLAGEFSGVYPRESPGSWQLIGHTDAPLWNLDRPTPALLTPGMWVQFREAR